MNGQVDIARLLLDAGADIECGDSDESTPLHVAALRGNREMVAFLLSRGADVNRRDRNGAYALSFAASGGDSTVVGLILDAGADLNYWQAQGITLLHFACSRNLTRLFDLLIDHGENINAASDEGITPIHWVSGRGSPEMLERMLAHGAEPSARDAHGTTPLVNAIFSENQAAAELLLDAGVDPDEADDRGTTPLIAAAWRGNSEVTRLLIDHGADVDHRDEEGVTALVRAVANGDPDVVEALLVAGADVDLCENHYGRSAIHVAAVLGYSDLAKSLIGKGASLDLEDGAGNAPVELAARYGHSDVVEILTASGAPADGIKRGKGALAAQGDLTEGEAVVWYLGHSGWAIKTMDHLLIFDYFNPGRDPGLPGLCNGHIRPAEITDENVTVFVTHEHGDHYDPMIFQWREDLADVTYVLGCQPEDASAYEYAAPREEKQVDGMRIFTIESNDTGVGYWIEVDGLVIFHAGDHANRHRDFSGPYKAEIDLLAERGAKPDIAFMPISGCGFGDQEAVKMGVHYALEALKPRVFMPMHAGGSEHRYKVFIADCEDEFPRTQMQAPEARGDRFRYRDGRIS
jgi:ankyrin repeat protein/L-ascorbate metabolism protein UlaG (beta-lactamase superfamily)